MKRQRAIAIISFMLVLVMLFSFDGAYKPSAEGSSPITEELTDEKSQDHRGDSLFNDQCGILNFVDENEFMSNGFTKRVPDAENLNTYVFEREDGTRGLYVFDEDVKFEDENGNILEKDISLQKTLSGFTTKQNNVGLKLPEQLSDGVTVSLGEDQLSVFSPTDCSDLAEIKDNSVKYSNVYGDNAHLVFTPTLSGVKQDIVLDNNIGKNQFDLVAFSATLKPFFDEAGELYFAKNDTDEYRFNFGSVFVYDSSGRFVGGSAEIEQIADCKWCITLIVPEEFLFSDNTVYPVVVDPQIKIQASTSSAYIEDTTIYSGKPNLVTGSWQYNHTGFISDGYDIGRILVKTPGLYNNTEFNNIQASRICSAKFCIKESSGTAAQEVKLYAYTGTAWNENTATWNNTSPNGSYSLIDTQYPVNGAWTEYNVTNLVNGWKTGTYTASKGFMLKSTNETDGTKYKAFDASESVTSSAKPYIVVIYKPLLFLYSSLININEGDTFTNSVITDPSGISVQWSSSNPSVASVSSTGVITGRKASATPVTITATAIDSYSSQSVSCTVYVKIPNGTYYMKNKSTGRNADASGYSVGDEVLRWSFHGASNQRWEITYLSNGEYSIKNNMSNLYLGVETIHSSSSITRQYSTLNDATKWYISKTSSGDYCFYAKGNLTYGYVIGASSSSTTTIVNMLYSNNTDFRDEWILTEFNKVSVRKITDETYREEYADYQVVIDGYMSIIASPFEKTWAISFEHGSWYEDYSLPAADCPLPNNMNCHEDSLPECWLNVQ